MPSGPPVKILCFSPYLRRVSLSYNFRTLLWDAAQKLNDWKEWMKTEQKQSKENNFSKKNTWKAKHLEISSKTLSISSPTTKMLTCSQIVKFTYVIFSRTNMLPTTCSLLSFSSSTEGFSDCRRWSPCREHLCSQTSLRPLAKCRVIRGKWIFNCKM